MIKKTAIIIGGSSDIGQEIAKEYAQNGYDLAVTFNKTNTEIAEAKKYKLNLCNSNEIENVFSQIKADCKAIDTLVYVSGVAQKRQLIMDVENEEIDNIFEVNVKSAIKCIREFVKIVANKSPANIVLIGSFVEKNGCSCESVYTASKSALTGLCKSLATELGNLNIRINVVAPGFIDTKMNNNLTQEEKEEIANMTPIQRLGTAKDVANLSAFLSSDKASFITGQTICVDGGLILD